MSQPTTQKTISQGLKSTGALDKKYKYEEAFQEETCKEYKTILPEFKKLYADIEPYAHARDVYNETALRNIEIMSLMRIVRRLTSAYENNGEEGYNNFKGRLAGYLKGWYKNYDSNIDQEVMAALLGNYKEMLDSKYYPEEITDEYLSSKQIDLSILAATLFDKSMMDSQSDMESILDLSPAEAVAAIKADPIYDFAARWHELNTNNVAPYNGYKANIDSLQRLYMKGQMKTFKKKKFWPDANSS